MAHANTHYRDLSESYLFSTIARRVSEFTAANPDKKVIRLGIGDVTKPLTPAVISALHAAVDEMGDASSFRGYGPEQGYDFLREAVVGYYSGFGVGLDADEVFISDGAKSDLANITDLFSNDNVIVIPDPVYPVYVDSNLMLGRNIRFLNGGVDNGFLPMPDDQPADIIYLCSPNNPTGAVYNRQQLTEWVSYANRVGAVILFDAAYEAFIQDPSLPRSIFEIEGAKTCAIEFCSFSKTAGFTGLRCGYTVVPKTLEFDGMNLNRMWNRRQTTKFNGVPYIVQRAAAAVFTEQGMRETQEVLSYYRENARIIAQTLQAKGVRFTGGLQSPYVWMMCPNGMASWDFFDYLLNNVAVVGTPGAGFGKNGEGCFRLTAFGNRENTIEAMQRIKDLL